MSHPNEFRQAIESLIRKHTEPLIKRIEQLEAATGHVPSFPYYEHSHQGYDYHDYCERCVWESGSR